MTTPLPLAPLHIKNQLAGNPKTPTFTVAAQLTSGRTLQITDPRALRAMVACMDMQAGMGGAASHWGGPAAFAEFFSAIYGLVFDEASQKNSAWYELYNLVNDAGHCENGIYALKANYQFAGLNLEALKGFRSVESKLTGHGEAHLFPEGVYISNGPLGSGLPQAQGLAIGDALAGRKRVTVTTISDGACMEGEAKEALTAIPGLAARGKLAPFVCVVSDNNTKLSGRIDADSFAMGPYFQSLEGAGWQVLHVKNGNDLQAALQTFEEALQLVRANPNRPVLIHAKTIKGKGIAKTEQSASGGHGFPLKAPDELPAFLQEIYGSAPVPQEFLAWTEELKQKAASKKSAAKPAIPHEKIQVGVSKALIAKKKAGFPIVSVTSDLPGSTGTAAFHKEFPESTIDVGVAEANMVSTAAGLSKSGFIPVVDTFAQFGVTKGALPQVMATLSQAPIIAIYSHTGFQDAADGASHQALTYLAMTCSLPEVDVYCLSCSQEAEALVGQAIERFASERKAGKVPHSAIFFLGREDFAQRYLPEGYAYVLGKAQIVKESLGREPKLVIATAGSLVSQAMEAFDLLHAENIPSTLVNLSVMNRPDLETLKTLLRSTGGRLLTLEDHQVIGGMGSLVIHALTEAGVAVKAKSLGVRGTFGQSAYKAADLYKKHGLDAPAVVKAAKALLA